MATPRRRTRRADNPQPLDDLAAELLGGYLQPGDLTAQRLAAESRKRGAPISEHLARGRLIKAEAEGRIIRVGMLYDPQSKRMVVAYRPVSKNGKASGA